jgi:hypothetical protein
MNRKTTTAHGEGISSEMINDNGKMYGGMLN